RHESVFGCQRHETPVRELADRGASQLPANAIDIERRRENVSRFDHEAEMIASALAIVDVGGGPDPALHLSAIVVNRDGAAEEPSVAAVDGTTNAILLLVGLAGLNRVSPQRPGFFEFVGVDNADVSRAPP